MMQSHPAILGSSAELICSNVTTALASVIIVVVELTAGGSCIEVLSSCGIGMGSDPTL